MTPESSDDIVVITRENLELLLEKPGVLDLTTWCNLRLEQGYPAFPASRWYLND